MRFKRPIVEDEVEVMEWPGAAYLVAACAFMLMVAVSVTDLIHWLATSYALPDGIRLMGLRYSDYAFIPAFALVAYFLICTSKRAWPGLLLIFGVSYYAIENWRGYRVLPGTFDQTEFARADGGTITLTSTSWLLPIVVGLVFGSVLALLRHRPRDLIRLTYWSGGLAVAAVLSNYMMIWMRPGMSMFAPTRHYAFTMLFTLAFILVGSAFVWERKQDG